jgi:hypothetical protein
MICTEGCIPLLSLGCLSSSSIIMSSHAPLSYYVRVGTWTQHLVSPQKTEASQSHQRNLIHCALRPAKYVVSNHTSTRADVFQFLELPDQVQLPGDNDLLGLGDIFALSPSSTLTFTHGESEAGLCKLPLSDTLPNGFQPRSYMCDHCGKTFGRPSQLRYEHLSIDS